MNETVFTIESTPIVFGAGAATETGFHLRRLGVRRVMLVSDPHVVELGITERVRAAVAELGIDTEVFAGARVEPSEESALEAIAAARDGGFDGFVGVGGGSSLDTAKIAALVTTHGGELLDWVNRPIGEARPVPGPTPAGGRSTDDGRDRERGHVGRNPRFPSSRCEDRHLAPLPATAARHRRPVADPQTSLLP